MLEENSAHTQYERYVEICADTIRISVYSLTLRNSIFTILFQFPLLYDALGQADRNCDVVPLSYSGRFSANVLNG